MGRVSEKRWSGHGKSRSGAYASWANMIARCHNERKAEYPRYGGRGISVCQAWRDSFASFYEHLGDRPPGTTLDRIDSRRNYEPGNVRWATPKQQQRNTKQNVMLTHNGETLCLAEWAERTGVKAHTLRYRFYRGLPVERILGGVRIGRVDR